MYLKESLSPTTAWFFHRCLLHALGPLLTFFPTTDYSIMLELGVPVCLLHCIYAHFTTILLLNMWLKATAPYASHTLLTHTGALRDDTCLFLVFLKFGSTVIATFKLNLGSHNFVGSCVVQYIIYHVCITSLSHSV